MYLKLLDREVKDYKYWLRDTQNNISEIVSAIYQNDDRDILVEKITSYGIASVIGLVLWNVVGALTGVGFVFTIITTIGSLLLSKFTFHKLYGKVRTFEDLNNEEKILVKKLESYLEDLKKEKIQLLKKGNLFFQLYPRKKQALKGILNFLDNTNVNLSYMYRKTYKDRVMKFKIQINKFNQVYAKVRI